MKAFLDTANLSEIEAGTQLGIFSGITTNPRLIYQEAQPVSYEKHIQRIRKLYSGTIFAQVIGKTAEDMVRQAIKINSWTNDIVIKIPFNQEGIRAISELQKVSAISTCATLIFSPAQALIAAMAGATYVAPFLKRITGVTGNGIATIQELVEIFSKSGISTQVIGASVETPADICSLAKAGVDAVTAPLEIWTRIFDNTMSNAILDQFLRGWQGSEV